MFLVVSDIINSDTTQFHFLVTFFLFINDKLPEFITLTFQSHFSPFSYIETKDTRASWIHI